MSLNRNALRRTALVSTGTIALVGIFIYALFMPHRSGDADLWFVPWLNFIAENGVIQSLATSMPVLVVEANGLGNYTPPYLYLLAVGSIGHGTLDSLTIIKLVSIAGTFLCAAGVYYLLRNSTSADQALIGAAGMFLLPSVLLNAAAWGQSDAIYSGFCIILVAAALRNNWMIMLAAFGAALAFKLQAVFIGPFLLYMVVSRRVPIIWWFTIPIAVYIVFMLPAWLAGRPALELAMVYFDQFNTWSWLSMNAPNPWAYVQYFNLMSHEVGVAIGLAVAVTAGLAIAGTSLRWRFEGTDLLLLALSSAALMPYILPKMHDRYFFIADVLAYALAVAKPRTWTIAVAVLIQLGSTGAYLAHLYGFKVGTPLGAIAIGIAIFIIAVQVIRSLGVLPWSIFHPKFSESQVKEA